MLRKVDLTALGLINNTSAISGLLRPAEVDTRAINGQHGYLYNAIDSPVHLVEIF